MKTSRILIVMACVALVTLMTLVTHRAAEAEKERVTLELMCHFGAAWFSWLTDQVVEHPEFSANWSLASPGSVEEVQSSLRDLLGELPSEDGWGNPLDIQVSGEDSGGGYWVRSAGPDGVFTTAMDGVFRGAECGDDIVWADGFFVCYPPGISVS